MNLATAYAKSWTGRWWIGPPNSENLHIFVEGMSEKDVFSFVAN